MNYIIFGKLLRLLAEEFALSREARKHIPYDPDSPEFPTWIEEMYGIHTEIHEGMISPRLSTVVDEKKYFLLQLKYPQYTEVIGRETEPPPQFGFT